MKNRLEMKQEVLDVIRSIENLLIGQIKHIPCGNAECEGRSNSIIGVSLEKPFKYVSKCNVCSTRKEQICDPSEFIIVLKIFEMEI